MPLISVVIPCYHHAPYLEEAVISIWKQLPDLENLARLEIVLCDDASPDDSAFLAKQLAQKSPCPMHVLENSQNLGAPKTSRKAAAYATGEFLVFHSSDDVMPLGRLAWQIGYLFAHADCDVIYGGGYRFYSTQPEHRLPLSLETTLKLFKAPIPVILAQLYTQSSPFFIQSAMLRMSAYREAIQTFSEDILADDWVLTIRLFERMSQTGRTFGFCDKDSLAYRLHDADEAASTGGNLHANLPKQTQAKRQVFQQFTPPVHRAHALATMYWSHYRRAVESGQWRLAWVYLLSSLRYGFKPVKGPLHGVNLLFKMLGALTR